MVGLLASVFAYGGLETVTIAAAESKDPVRGVAERGAHRDVADRALLRRLDGRHRHRRPLGRPGGRQERPVRARCSTTSSIPAAGQIMNVVILVALLSAMNANLYGASRMAYSLIARGQGPAVLGQGQRRGAAPGGADVLRVRLRRGAAELLWPDTVFQWLLNMVGAAVLVVWGFIAAAQLRMRRLLERESPEKLVVKMWAFPVLTWVALAGIAAVLLLMLRDESQRIQLLFTGGFGLVLTIVGLARQRSLGRGADLTKP